MRAVVIFLCIVAAVFTVASQQLDKWNRAGPSPVAMASAVPAAPVASDSGRTATLHRDRLGHFQTDARIDGRSVDLMIDTGASVIALRESTAARLGIHPSVRDYTAKVNTANGVARAAPVMLNRVEVRGLTVRDVEAFVMPDSSLGANLLGMSFLSRVKWSYDRGRLVLEQ